MKIPKEFKLKKDRYSIIRSGISQLWNIHCKKCGNELLLYQKDGSGHLKRTYFDRIIWPKLNNKKELICKKCKKQIGIAYIYTKEKRPAYMMEIDSITKKIISKNSYGKITKL